MPDQQKNDIIVESDNSPKITKSTQEEQQQPKAEIVVVEKSCGKTGGVSNSDKWVIAIIIGIIFFILATSFLFRCSNYIFRGFGLPTCTPSGKPTIAGLIIHAIIFIVLVRILMH